MPAPLQLPLHSPRPAASPLTWRQADHDVFVADSSGAYAGHVTADDADFTVYDAVGVRLGVAPTIAEARALLARRPAPGADAPASSRRRGRRGSAGRPRGRRRQAV